MLPPEDVEAALLWQKLSEHPRPSDVVDFPRKDGEGRPIAKIRMQVLTLEQHDEARLRAQAHLKDERKLKLEDFATEIAKEVIGDAVAVELLALACVSVKPIKDSDSVGGPVRYARMFRDGNQIRTSLAADEIATLFTTYLMVQRKFGPTERLVASEEDLTAWIRRLAEGGNEYPLAPLDSLQLASLTTSLAVRAYSLSQILASQRSTLPPTLALDLESWGIGTSFSGVRPERSTETGGENSDEPGRLTDAEPGEEISVEAAAEVARRLSGG